MKNVYYIPEKAKYVIVSDIFAKDYSGGAELTLDAILQKCPEKYFEVYSHSLTPNLIEKNHTKHWIVANFANADINALAELVRSNVPYSIIECDYKYCKYRSSHLHKIKEGLPCDCNKQRSGRFVRALYAKAHRVYFMSQKQLEEYTRVFPEYKSNNFVVQSSTFSDETLQKLVELRKNRKPETAKEKYAILKGGTWIKAEKETIKWCEENNIDYELLGGLSHQEFLKQLSKYRGLVFRPAGYDTCPRIVIEARLLGLELKLNSNVQHRDEQWFIGTIEECEKYLKTRAKAFWSNIAGNKEN